MMKIGLFHGYNLGGSGSNEYTRYLAIALLQKGVEVHLICREPAADTLGFVDAAIRYDKEGRSQQLFSHGENQSESGARCYLHELPLGAITPVYVTDKQRDGVVKSFSNMDDQELLEYENVSCRALKSILTRYPLDLLHCNHVTYQPQIAEIVCQQTGTPYIIYPHGSAIEYTVKTDERYFTKVRESLQLADGLIIGNNEVRNRLVSLYPELKSVILENSEIVGVGVDTSLFASCEPEQRQQSLDSLINLNLGGGKSSELTREMEQRLDSGELKAVTEYRNEYVQKLADSSISEKLGELDLDKPLMLFVGALTAGKGLQGLLCALATAHKQNPDIQLVIVGAGAYRETLEGLVHLLSTGNLELLKEMAATGFDLDFSDTKGPWEDVVHVLNESADELLANASGLKDKVKFVGRLNHDELKFLFPIADLAVFPSVVPEAYPLVLMESLSNGVLPVVSYFSGFTDGIDELADVIPQELLSKMKIPMAAESRIGTMAANICDILASDSFRTIRPKLREVACDRYDWNLRADQMIAAYQSVIDEQSGEQRKAA